MDPEEYELIEKYLKKELSAVELKDFEERLAADTEFAATVNTYWDINDSLQAQSDRKKQEAKLKQTLENTSQDYFKNVQKTGRVVSMRNIYWAAASILLIISFIFIFNQQSAPTYIDYASYDPLVLSTRSDAEELSGRAEEAFNNQQYDEAARVLEQLVKAQPENTHLKIYWALSLIESGKFTLADSTLTAIENGNSLYTQTATWYLALSFLKQEKIQACRIQLKKISPGDYKYEEARQLLEEL